MSSTKRWQVEVFIDEHETTTRAEARLQNRDKTGIVGVGSARRSPAESEFPEIGDELAVSRALADLSQRLLEAAVADVEGVTQHPAHLKS